MADDATGPELARLGVRVDALGERVDAMCRDNAREHEALRTEILALVTAQLAGIRTAVEDLRTQFAATIATLFRLVFVLVAVLGSLALTAWGVQQIPKLLGGP